MEVVGFGGENDAFVYLRKRGATNPANMEIYKVYCRWVRIWVYKPNYAFIEKTDEFGFAFNAITHPAVKHPDHVPRRTVGKIPIGEEGFAPPSPEPSPLIPPQTPNQDDEDDGTVFNFVEQEDCTNCGRPMPRAD